MLYFLRCSFLAVTLLFSLAPDALAGDLVKNGDFARGAEGGVLDGGRSVPGGASRAAVALQPWSGPDGSTALRLDARGEVKGVAASTAPFGFTEGRRYRLSYRAKRLTPGDAQLAVNVQWVAPGGRVRGGPAGSNSLVFGDRWCSLGFEFEVPSNVKRAQLTIRVPSERAVLVDDVSLVELPGELVIASLAPRQVASLPGTPSELVARLRNPGSTPLQGLRGTLRLGGEDRSVSAPDLGPGEERELVLAVPALAAGPHPATLTLRSRLSAPTSASTRVLVASEDEAEVVVESGHTRLAFLRTGDLHGLIVLEVREGDEWRAVGAQPGLARLLRAGESEDVWLQGEVSLEGGTAVARVEHGPLKGSLSWEAVGDGWFRVEADLSSDRTFELARFVFPELHAGWGAAGARKDSACFGGLEFLDAERVSSGTDAISAELAPRFVPHPLEVALPVMAVEHAGLAIGVTWDPEQRWDGTRAQPASLFASPNRWLAQDDHLMALFLPSAPEFVPVGEDRASTPYTLRRGQALHLEAELFALPVETGVEDALAAWYVRHGAPSSGTEREAGGRRAVDAMLESFDTRTKGWPYAGEEEPGFYSEVAQTLLNFGISNEGPRGARALGQVDAAVAHLVAREEGGRLGIPLSLHVGQVRRNLSAGRGSLGRLAKQRADGSWGYETEGGENNIARLGKAGTAALGISADHLTPILAYARASGDPRALRSVLAGLRFTETLRVPFGSQTWEVPILAPDLLSVQEGIDLQLDAFELTGDPRHLSEARRWARTGLAFISTWERPDRPGQRYASTAVFGGTFFGAAWWGRPVQWLGLVYAGAILRLAPHEPEFPWREIAEGLVESCVEQQTLALADEAHNPWPGSYADFYRLSDGLVLGKWIGPWTLVRQLNHLNGVRASDFRRLSHAGQRALQVTTAARILSSQWTEAGFAAELEYAPGRSPHTLLAQVLMPTEVLVDGRALPQVPDLDQVAEGWLYDTDLKTLIVRHQFTDRSLTLRIPDLATSPHARR